MTDGGDGGVEQGEPSGGVSWREFVVGNAYALSLLYLVAGLVMESVRRVAPRPALEAAVRRLDDLPGAVLHLLGLLPYLQRAQVYEGWGTWTVRVVFGLTTMAVIFLLAVATGLALGGARWVLLRLRTR
ncbi:MAG: hypothetical protein FJ086_14935 [Deltaproteobacteria bacterium]|nr:hypothetical protein [Deltaproteobacteria bacterium]